MTDKELNALMALKDCRTCKYGGIDEQLGIPLCRVSTCQDFEGYEVENSLDRLNATVSWFRERGN